MQGTETLDLEDEEQALDRLLDELGISLPVVKMDMDDENLSGSISSRTPIQPLWPDEFRDWLLTPAS
jgi:hypothetical protein